MNISFCKFKYGIGTWPDSTEVSAYYATWPKSFIFCIIICLFDLLLDLMSLERSRFGPLPQNSTHASPSISGVHLTLPEMHSFSWSHISRSCTSFSPWTLDFHLTNQSGVVQSKQNLRSTTSQHLLTSKSVLNRHPKQSVHFHFPIL